MRSSPTHTARPTRETLSASRRADSSLPRLPTLLAICTLLVLVGPGITHAFPPAPTYTVFGNVRDQVGQRIVAEGAEIVLLKDGAEIGRTPVRSNQLDRNYELNIRIDMNRSGTALYSENAVSSQGLFSLMVEMNGSLFYPIEVDGDLTAGQGGERVRLDLTLGEDRDGDGLPDVWEMWQLYQAGFFPDENGDWPLGLIGRNDDFDGDGLSNHDEYIAGTFAGDATETFGLKIKEKSETSARFEFFAITGKTYTLESSVDAQTWTRIPFSVAAPAPGEISHTAVDVGILSAFTTPLADASDRELFRLTVR